MRGIYTLRNTFFVSAIYYYLKFKNQLIPQKYQRDVQLDYIHHQ